MHFLPVPDTSPLQWIGFSDITHMSQHDMFVSRSGYLHVGVTSVQGLHAETGLDLIDRALGDSRVDTRQAIGAVMQIGIEKLDQFGLLFYCTGQL